MVTFASPRVGNLGFKHLYASLTASLALKTVRFYVHSDAVPLVPQFDPSSLHGDDGEMQEYHHVVDGYELATPLADDGIIAKLCVALQPYNTRFAEYQDLDALTSELKTNVEKSRAQLVSTIANVFKLVDALKTFLLTVAAYHSMDLYVKRLDSNFLSESLNPAQRKPTALSAKAQWQRDTIDKTVRRLSNHKKIHKELSAILAVLKEHVVVKAVRGIWGSAISKMGRAGTAQAVDIMLSTVTLGLRPMLKNNGHEISLLREQIDFVGGTLVRVEDKIDRISSTMRSIEEALSGDRDDKIQGFLENLRLRDKDPKFWDSRKNDANWLDKLAEILRNVERDAEAHFKSAVPELLLWKNGQLTAQTDVVPVFPHFQRVFVTLNQALLLLETRILVKQQQWAGEEDDQNADVRQAESEVIAGHLWRIAEILGKLVWVARFCELHVPQRLESLYQGTVGQTCSTMSSMFTSDVSSDDKLKTASYWL